MRRVIVFLIMSLTNMLYCSFNENNDFRQQNIASYPVIFQDRTIGFVEVDYCQATDNVRGYWKIYTNDRQFKATCNSRDELDMGIILFTALIAKSFLESRSLEYDNDQR